MVANLPAKTGRSLAEWLAALAASGTRGPKEAAAWLKREHGLGTGTAVLIAEIAQPGGEVRIDPDAYLAAASGYVEAQFAGPKAGLLPVLEAVLECARGLGWDVRVCPGTTIVPLYRRHVFAQVKATTRARVDLGLALGGADRKIPARLIDTGGAARKDRITHRIALAKPADLDREARKWLETAYRLDA